MKAVYIMANRSRTLYVGVTSDLNKRVWQHKNGTFGGFTDRYKVDRLVYYEGFAWMVDAITREKQLKRWSRVKKIALIEKLNPTWADLSDGWYHQATVSSKSTADPSTRARKASRSLGMTKS